MCVFVFVVFIGEFVVFDEGLLRMVVRLFLVFVARIAVSSLVLKSSVFVDGVGFVVGLYFFGDLIFNFGLNLCFGIV